MASTLQEILSCVNEDRHWISTLEVVQSDGETIVFFCATQGVKSSYPVGAVDQPTKGWPRNSCYRFLIMFHGNNMWGDLKEMLTFWNVCPGCKLIESQHSHKSRTTMLELGSRTLECTKHHVQAPLKVGTFLPNKMV